jgi:hypothetical protein
MVYDNIHINDNLKAPYSDVYTPEALRVLSDLAHFNFDIKRAMTSRLKLREDRQKHHEKITFLDPESYIT